MRNGWRSHLRELEAVQPWPCYYPFRAGELDVVQRLCPLPEGDTMLELGCGNAFHSYLFSDRFRRLVATDLHAADRSTHTIGLQRARELARILSFDSVRVVAADASALPLAANSIDFVFSSNVLEHVPDRARAVREIARVLRPGGWTLNIMPAAMERVYNLPMSYLGIVMSMFRGVAVHRDSSAGRAPAPDTPTAGVDAGGRSFTGRAQGFFRRHYPTFPFPKPHGEYASSTEEFVAHLPRRWERLFRSGGLEIESTFATILAPHSLAVPLSQKLAFRVARAGWPMTRLLGGRAPLKWLGTSYAVLARKSAQVTS